MRKDNFTVFHPPTDGKAFSNILRKNKESGLGSKDIPQKNRGISTNCLFSAEGFNSHLYTC
ncbi:MAG: hypothetical protein ABI237_03025 [Ginsengibacter sp.]